VVSSDAFALALGTGTLSVPASHAGPCRAAAHSTLSNTGTAPPTAPKEKRSNSPPAPPGRTHPARAPPGDAFVLLGATAEASLVEMLGETVGRRRALRRSSPRYAASVHGPDLPTRAGCGGRIGGRQPAARLAVALRRGRAGAVPGLELLLVCWPRGRRLVLKSEQPHDLAVAVVDELGQDVGCRLARLRVAEGDSWIRLGSGLGSEGSR